MTIEIYADGATLENIDELNESSLIKGVTTNPSLINRAGITDYEKFAKEMVAKTDKPISFEVIADDLDGMYREARIISGWGDNVYVKVPPMTTDGISTQIIAEKLTGRGIKLNLTCLFTYSQIETAIKIIGTNSGILSIFAGRIMDTHRDACPLIHYAHNNVFTSKTKVLWASTREIWNIRQAEESGADIITVPVKMLPKIKLIGKNLLKFSKETVLMFRQDAVASGYKI